MENKAKDKAEELVFWYKSLLTPLEQIQSLESKIAENFGSKDKMDLWLVEHWTKEIEKLKSKTEKQNHN